MEQWRAPGTQTSGTVNTGSCVYLKLIILMHSQIFSVPAQVWIICSSTQSHTHWLSIHNASQSKNNGSKNGGHPIRTKTEPQFFFHQHDELCCIFRQCQAQPHRPGETWKPSHSPKTELACWGFPHSSACCFCALLLLLHS